MVASLAQRYIDLYDTLEKQKGEYSDLLEKSNAGTVSYSDVEFRASELAILITHNITTISKMENELIDLIGDKYILLSDRRIVIADIREHTISIASPIS